MTLGAETTRAHDVHAGVRLEIFTVIWMLIEAAVSLAAGIVAGSILLTAFGLDSVIELVSGSVLLWRFQVEARGGGTQRTEAAEHRAAWFVAVTLAMLCVYVLVSSLYGLATQAKPDTSLAGIAISLSAVMVMPYLAWRKRKLAARINSDALRGDAAESLTCGYMAATVLIGVALNALFHWWWVEDIAALAFLGWLAMETREAFEEAREEAGDND